MSSEVGLHTSRPVSATHFDIPWAIRTNIFVGFTMTLAKHNFPLYVCMCEKHKIYKKNRIWVSKTRLGYLNFSHTLLSVMWLFDYITTHGKLWPRTDSFKIVILDIVATRSFLWTSQLLIVVSMSSVNVSTLQFQIKLDHNCCILFTFLCWQ